jgi:hypothetical protein
MNARVCKAQFEGVFLKARESHEPAKDERGVHCRVVFNVRIRLRSVSGIFNARKSRNLARHEIDHSASRQ